MQKVITIDPSKCTGCRICEIVCSLTKEGVVNPLKARIQIVKDESRSLSVPMICQQCYNAPCTAMCPAGALDQENNSGLVIHDPNLCVGCKSCVVVCPFGAIGIDTEANKVFKCDHCGGDPTCVSFCETEAIQLVDAKTLNLKIKRAALDKLDDLIHRYSGQIEV